jgi:hypothetical protein
MSDLSQLDGSGDDRLLAGEMLRSDSLQDAEHWAAVYEELTGFLLQVDLDVTETLRRFRCRLEYWRRRRDELAARG